MLTQHADGTKQSKHQKTNLRQVNIFVCLFEGRAMVGLQLHVLGTQKKQIILLLVTLEWEMIWFIDIKRKRM